MKKLVGIYKCRHCGQFSEVPSIEGALPDESFNEPFDNRLFNLNEAEAVVTSWVIKDNPVNSYSQFKMVIVRHCAKCLSNVVIFDLAKISLVEVK